MRLFDIFEIRFQKTTEGTGVPSKVHIVKLVKVQPGERLATTSVLNPALSLVTDCCEARGMRYQAAIER
jgi:hypothetical protein